MEGRAAELANGRRIGAANLKRLRLEIRGRVQGVGFRPFVYRLARAHHLSGLVRNDAQGVLIEAQGEPEALQRFVEELPLRAPSLAHIQSLTQITLDLQGDHDFQIVSSAASELCQLSLPADLATCPDCLREVADPIDRRYGHPVISCTQCGPRYSIVLALPYDRDKTSLRGFAMCAACQREYHDPESRRFHAQPIGCYDCGPQLQSPLAEAVAWLLQGEIVTVKGVGGYHQLCRADCAAAVARLRERKNRPRQPLAVMAGHLEEIGSYCRLSETEANLLKSPARPIVLLRSLRRLRGVAPGQARTGWMLAYTALHHLLLEGVGGPLVVTSSNRPGEPVQIDDAPIPGNLLTHDRPIHNRCDDSLAYCLGPQAVLLRRARGYCPEPLKLGAELTQPILACGSTLKSSLALGLGDSAYLSPHLGDLHNLASREAYTQARRQLQELLGVSPVLAVRDLHPDCPAARMNEDLPQIAVQHHHAHIVSAMVEHGLHEEVLGLAFDGSGYGSDGTIWGGEFLVADRARFFRVDHFPVVPMAGGDLAVREPWRMAAAYLQGLDYSGLDWWRCRRMAEQKAVLALLAHPSTPKTSSLGRLFDAAACLILGKSHVGYEAEGAMELEALACGRKLPAYPLEALWPALLQDVRAGASRRQMARRFHAWVAEVALSRCVRLAEGRPVVLSGGVFQNATLLETLSTALLERGLRVYFNRQVPSNDGGLCLGQLGIAACRLKSGDVFRTESSESAPS